eukprot:TRINITY_DN11290_c0_g1_i4.p1 TRINITY_DN11290_c0_g1~~TRINITY_DN11290_c0_g1_i4.p1  ORF type:complete len:378 (-),score=74.17 TRINITY_DN11290_c0_g1_i4:804-1937(-)
MLQGRNYYDSRESNAPVQQSPTRKMTDPPSSSLSASSVQRHHVHTPQPSQLIPAEDAAALMAANAKSIAQGGRDVFNLGYKDMDMAKLSVIMPLGSTAIRIFTYPPSLIKTRMMANLPVGAVAYRNTRHAFFDIVRNEGFPALYRGFLTASMNIPLGTIYVSTMEISKDWLVDNTSLTNRDSLTSFLAAATASSFTQTFGVPIDVVTQRRMLIRSRNSGISAREIIGEIYRTEGILGFYRGYVASLLCFVPHSAILWSIYSHSRHFLRSQLKETDNPLTRAILVGHWNVQEALVTAGSGFFAGLSTSMLTNPLDVIRTRQQTQAEVMSLKQTVLNIYDSLGVSGYWRGVWPRALAMGPASALTFSSYEILKQLSVKE